jgi:hypothetical protein
MPSVIPHSSHLSNTARWSRGNTTSPKALGLVTVCLWTTTDPVIGIISLSPWGCSYTTATVYEPMTRKYTSLQQPLRMLTASYSLFIQLMYYRLPWNLTRYQNPENTTLKPTWSHYIMFSMNTVAQRAGGTWDVTSRYTCRVGTEHHPEYVSVRHLSLEIHTPGDCSLYCPVYVLVD